jgi:hypothetical protein
MYSFYACRYQKSKKIQLSHKYIFTLLGSASVIAVRRTLMKLSLELQKINKSEMKNFSPIILYLCLGGKNFFILQNMEFVFEIMANTCQEVRPRIGSLAKLGCLESTAENFLVYTVTISLASGPI